MNVKLVQQFTLQTQFPPCSLMVMYANIKIL